MVNATKKQLMEFISTNFVNSNNEHPTTYQLDIFKKDELAKVVEDSRHIAEFDSYINSLR